MEIRNEWTTGDFRRRGAMVLELLAEFVDRGRGRDRPVVRVRGIEDLARIMDLDGLPAGTGLDDEGFRRLLEGFLDNATNVHHPAFAAHQIAVPHYASALADLISGVLANGMSVYEMGPAAGTMEVTVIDWMLDKIGWQPTGRNRDRRPANESTAGGGVLTHGGSLANLTAMLAARAAMVPDAWVNGTPKGLVVVAPECAHYSLSRAVATMGLGSAALIAAPSDELGRIEPGGLPDCFDRITGEGRTVMAVVANACATATGLYDPVREVGEICRERNLWFHVDGAHGASALLHPEERVRLDGIDLADSVVWDAHKLLQTSALCAAVLVRDGRHLTGAFRQDAVYVTEGEREIGHDFIPHQFECTKVPLGLKLMLVLALAGERGLAESIGVLWENTRRFHGQISAREGFEVLCAPESNILNFRVDGDDGFQTRIRKAIMHEGDFLLSQADVGGRRWLRMAVMNPLTDEATVERLLDRIGELAAELHG
jgi:L-2,4-diaminobutyrate decarboxylase